jgi:hypothetical protein
LLPLKLVRKQPVFMGVIHAPYPDYPSVES